MSYNLSKKEIDTLMKGLVIKVDNREQRNELILKYFVDKNIEYMPSTLETGDYSCYIKANPELGILRDIHIPSVVEKKANFDELASNLQKSTETRFINELIRSQDYNFVILVEDGIGYTKLINGQYRSGYKPEALLGRINSLKAKYKFEFVYMDGRLSGNWIYYHLYYQAREYLKNL